MSSTRDHWRAVYTERDPTSVSWHQKNPARSLILIEETRIADSDPIIDIGGGASRLADRLLDLGFLDVTVLDIAEPPLRAARERLGDRAHHVTWIEADVLTHPFERRFAVWHDRATFHFLTNESDRTRYVEQVNAALGPGGHLIVGGFAPDGPESCSGLPVERHDAESLASCFASFFEPVGFQKEAHRTPAGATQHFLYGRFRRIRD